MPRETYTWTKIADADGNIYDSMDDVPREEFSSEFGFVIDGDPLRPDGGAGSLGVVVDIDDGSTFSQETGEMLSYVTPVTTTVITSSTWVCRRCGRSIPKDQLVNDLCVDGKYGLGCYDDDEDTDLGEDA